MPWTPEQSTKHDSKAKNPVEQRQWADVANSTLKRTGDDALAVKEANGVIKKRGMKQSAALGDSGIKTGSSPKRGPRKVIKAKR